MMMMAQEGMGGRTLDDIVNQNAKMMRRQSMPQTFGSGSPHPHVNPEMRQMSMMEYPTSTASGGQLSNFEYDTSAGMDQTDIMSGGITTAQEQHRRVQAARRQSADDLSLRTAAFASGSQNFNPMISSNSAYASPVHSQGGMDMSMDSPYLESRPGMNIDYAMDQNFNDSMGGNAMQMNMYNQAQFNQSALSSPMPQQGTPHSGHVSSHTAGGNSSIHSQYGNQSGSSSNTLRQLSRPRSLHVSDISSPAQGASPMSAPPQSTKPQNFPAQGQHANSGFPRQPQNPTPGSQQDRGMHVGQSQEHFDGINGPVPANSSNFNPNNQGFPWGNPKGGWPSTMVGRPHMQSAYKNAYSSTGFDMLGVLVSSCAAQTLVKEFQADVLQMRVATRPNPEINIGSVDLSCAFVVCDAEKDDFPIVYCSDNFERLTGYTKHMILGRNCRFLQSPDGNVAPGIRRKYVDDDSVFYLKNMISLRRESQISLINYRRGGQPFMNLLTVIPISWDTDQVKYFVGFQVDLVEQPSAVTNRNPGMSSLDEIFDCTDPLSSYASFDSQATHEAQLLTARRWLVFNQLSAWHDDASLCHERTRHIAEDRFGSDGTT